MDFPSLVIGDLIARTPIVQGGMGVGISLSGLASAVANEGGIGVIAAVMVGMNEKDLFTNFHEANKRALAREIQKARKKTEGILGVNIMVALTNFADMVETAIKEKIDIIFSGAGLPLDLPKYLTEGAKTKLVPIVSSARAAALLCKKWLTKYSYLPDGFVVEGPKAGGHLGFKKDDLDKEEHAVEQLVPEVVKAIQPYLEKKNIPVIAAGGVYSGQDIKEMLDLGASGVQMGTRFVATHECDAHDAFKESYVEADEEDLGVIISPVGLPGRALKNEFLNDVSQGKKKPFKCLFQCLKTCDFENTPYCIAQALVNAQRGKLNKGFAFAGSNAFRIKAIFSVKELIDSLRKEYIEAVSAA